MPGDPSGLTHMLTSPSARRRMREPWPVFLAIVIPELRETQVSTVSEEERADHGHRVQPET